VLVNMANMSLRRLSILVLLASMALSAPALTVGLAPAEGKEYAPPPEGQGSPMGYLVSGCMSALFEAGHIATDAVVSRVARESWGASEYGLPEAREGRVDYMIALYVAWASSAFHNLSSLPASIDYRLVRVLDGKVVAEGSMPGPSDSENASAHEARTASLAGASAVGPCLRMLTALATGGE
jgi:hypothetical protein